MGYLNGSCKTLGLYSAGLQLLLKLIPFMHDHNKGKAAKTLWPTSPPRKRMNNKRTRI